MSIIYRCELALNMHPVILIYFTSFNNNVIMSVPVIPSGNLFNCTFYSITVRRAIISARSKNTSFNAKQVFTAYGISELELEKTLER